MYGHHVFAVLFASDEKNQASSASKLLENSKWYREATGGVAERPTLTSREATPACDDEEGERKSTVDCLVITFDEVLKNFSDGLQFRMDPNTSDLLLEHRGISKISATH
ncbi:hypothetical protein F4860DRAFT_112067 [Xylaria cubensis]|nr:hypothetical protein F4860DRAFT_112067 [Xylaria cubensis]